MKGIYYTFLDTAEVLVDEIADSVIENYISTKEPYDKAGGYAIQGFMAKYIRKINGNYHTIVGLPVCKLNKFLLKMKVL